MSDRTLLNSGSIYGHLFENSAVNVERWVFWAASFEVPGDPELSISIEWLRFDPALQPLDQTVICTSETHPDAEASVYVFSHEWIDTWSLELTPLPDGGFSASLQATVPVEDDEGDITDTLVKGTANVGFDGILLMKGNMAARNKVEATDLLAPFTADLTFAVAEDDQRFVFSPKS